MGPSSTRVTVIMTESTLTGVKIQLTLSDKNIVTVILDVATRL